MNVDEKLNQLIELVEAWIAREEADGCHCCVFIEKEEWEMPCVKCRRNSKDYWRARIHDEETEHL